ncbi:hypothetical protein M9458_038444, partial [Cirrhinus mrigala]
ERLQPLPFHPSQTLTQQQETRNTGNWSPCTLTKKLHTHAVVLKRLTAMPWGGGGRQQGMK